MNGSDFGLMVPTGCGGAADFSWQSKLATEIHYFKPESAGKLYKRSTKDNNQDCPH